MDKQYPKSIYELIDSENFRKRAAMYLGVHSISKLRTFMDGYHTCELLHEIKEEDTKPPFWLFFHWICKKYKHSGSYYNWDGIILQNCDHDESKALDLFFKQFDEFRTFKPQKILTCNITENEIQYFHSHKGIRWSRSNGEDKRIGPATNIFIIEYDNDLGCSSHHRKEGQRIITDYFRTIEQAIENVERSYGKSLNWAEVPKTKLDMVYETII